MVLQLHNVTQRYNLTTAVKGVSLELRESERLAALGPSGCGKTTLLRLIAGFLTPDEGSITIEGLLVAQEGRCLVEPERRQVGMVFQDLALWPHMSVEGNLEFGLKAQGVPRTQRRQRVADLLARVQLREYAQAHPGELSGGQQQRVALARALVLRPKLLLMDEPLSNLDHDLNLRLREEILRLQQDLGTTLIYVTHARDEAFALGTRVAVMGGGEILRSGTPAEVREFFGQRASSTAVPAA